MRISSISTLFVGFVTLLGCGSSDDTTPTNTSSGGSSGAASSGLPSGVTRVACYKAASKSCTMHGESSQSGIDTQRSTCTSEGGTAADHCPAADLVGCCVIAGLGECSYDAASSLQSSCGAGGTQYSTSAP